ncbi:MAG: SGNH hydrolase domain-containing protein, partial [Aeromonas sp.]
LVVVLNYAGEIANPQWVAVGLMLSLLLGELSLRAVENPTRKLLAKCSQKKEFVWLLIALSFVGLMALVARYQYQRIDWRIDQAVQIAANEASNYHPLRNECWLDINSKIIKSPLCRYGQGKLTAVVIGDSHANASVSAITVANKSATAEMTFAGCPVVIGMKIRHDTNNKCYEFSGQLADTINSMTENEMLLFITRGSRYVMGHNENDSSHNIPAGFYDQQFDSPNAELNSQYKKSLINTMCSIKNPSRVYLVRPIPEMGIDVPNTMARALMFGKPDPQVSISLEEYHTRHKVVWAAQDAAARQCGVKILDPLPYLCHDGRCWGSKDGRPLYYDDNHLSEFGNKLLVPMFKQAFAEQAALEHGSGRSD